MPIEDWEDQLMSLPRNPHDWDNDQITAAFVGYFASFYGNCEESDEPNPLYHPFKDQPPVTRQEFMTAVLLDYDEAAAGKTTHPLFGNSSWEWASVERESVRDRILIARGHKPIGWTGDKDFPWPDERFKDNP